MTEPEHFIYTHFATQDSWNLQENGKKWTKKQFESMPDLKSYYFSYNLKLMSYENQNIVVVLNNSLMLKVRVEKDIYLSSKVKFYDQKGDSEIENLSYAIRSEEDENVYEIYFTFK
jgi:transglutaminase/protease-like cytokinesis protein 3